MAYQSQSGDAEDRLNWQYHCLLLSGKIRQLADLWSRSDQAGCLKMRKFAQLLDQWCPSLPAARVDLLLELPNGFDNGVPLWHFAEDHPGHGRVVSAQLDIHFRQ